jgi:hypothetical protein
MAELPAHLTRLLPFGGGHGGPPLQSSPGILKECSPASRW